MRSVCIYFHIHQPFRLRTYRFFDIGDNHYYYDDFLNRSIIRRVASNCYLPANKMFLELISKYPEFKVSFSISGTTLEQMEMYVPEVIESFQALAKSGSVEFIAETYSHSLLSLKAPEEFKRQVSLHREKIAKLFGVEPVAFRNTELIYSDAIGEMVAEMGFDIMLTEGAKHVLGWKSPDFVYCNALNPKLKLLLRNFQLSDDIAFRFSNRGWSEWPLTAEKFTGWLNAINPKHEVVNLFMDYDAIGEYQSADTGIFDFIEALPGNILTHSNFTFSTPGNLAIKLRPKSAIHVPYPISWADTERDLTAWIGNDLQDDAFETLCSIEPKVKFCKNPDLLRDWNYLQSSDHFYYMCTKWFSDGETHKYVNPYSSPYEAYINYMNVLSDVIVRIENECLPEETSHKLSETDKPATDRNKTKPSTKTGWNQNKTKLPDRKKK